ncbi:Uncharacterised protein family (UPF0164) [Alkalispirochaeta americana]|uniref:Uncharacterized protein family (UPF0164) n=1 Tax=Alkalispirochaeta americana TaxID=159291 RepID=A0A1N6P180_9SPIO|nr:UPF0164 family protein [Alkalispirochaeta americana]SIP97892.1 Uncharacterised protein family (UPF0164) [Alkalispirochaeta americana]
MYIRMAQERRFTAVLLLFVVATVLVVPAFASGVSEDSFHDWYGDIHEQVGGESVQNTGLTVFPTLMIPMGGEQEGMGTAYTAVSRDASFLEANPAASSRLEKTEAAVFHNNLIADTNMEGAVYTSRRENLGYGVGAKHLHVPFTSYDDYGGQLGTARYSETVVAGNVSYNFFSGFYFSGISLGANVKAAYRHIPDRIAPGQSAAGVMTDLGILTRFHFLKPYSSQEPNFSLGTAIKNLGPPVLDEPLPTVWSTGISWAPLRPLLLAADIHVPIMPFSDQPPPDPSYAVGAALTVTDFFVLRSGFLLMGGNPRLTMGSGIQIQEMTITVNYTLDMTTQLSAFDRFSIQAAFSLGDRGRGDRRDQVRTLYLDSLQHFAVGELEEAIYLNRQALALDPSFEPARETLAMAARMLDLQNRMESIRLDEDRLRPDERLRE